MITSFFPLPYTSAALAHQFSFPQWGVSQCGCSQNGNIDPLTLEIPPLGNKRRIGSLSLCVLSVPLPLLLTQRAP